MLRKIGLTIACGTVALASAAFAQTSSSSSSSTDPFVKNREEKAAAKAEYKKERAQDKKVAKQKYKEERKAANQELKATGVRSDTEKNQDLQR